MIDKRLPIKLIMPKQGKPKPVMGGGGRKEPFRPVDSRYRQRLSDQVGAVRESLPKQIEKTGGVPARLFLIPEAIAKSHRPEKLFSEKTCPIIGAGGLGELFVKATPNGLDRLDRMVRKGDSRRLVKELSTVSGIEPITPEFRLGNVSAKELLRESPKKGDRFKLRVKLFDFGFSEYWRESPVASETRGFEDWPDAVNEKLTADFEDTCGKRDIPIARDGYSSASFTYSAECRDTKDVNAISRVIGVRSVRRMPLVHSVRSQALDMSVLPAFPARAEYSDDVPAVVVVDTGISNELPQLESWVFGRESYVQPSYSNTYHGTFVAALVCWPAVLNPTLEGLSTDPCGVFDLQVIPNHTLDEQEFLVCLEDSLKGLANKYKVWNLSLNTNDICLLDEFSSLAQQLDNLQKKYQVSFVVSAGNYDSKPLLDYPRTRSQREYGRIMSPADTVLGITVGSISHIDYKDSGPRKNEPSPFSRNGSGPNHIIKPDLVHYGGSCSADGLREDGIRSINSARSVKDLGTSFSTPLVSRTLAQIYHYLIPTPSPVLARALLTHHSLDPRTNDRVPDGEEKYFGFGRPTPVPYCLECTPHSSTLILEEDLMPGYSIEWDDFPYPSSLHRDGRYYGEVWMTIAFAPALGTGWGAEYCETHVEANFGVYYEKVSRKTGEVTTEFRGLVPPEHKNPGVLYELRQVAELRKWAPVRTYHGQMGKKGERGLRWRLKLRLFARHGVERKKDFKAQPFALIITIADPEKKVLVYDEMSQIIRNRFETRNIAVKTPVRIRMHGQEENFS